MIGGFYNIEHKISSPLLAYHLSIKLALVMVYYIMTSKMVNIANKFQRDDQDDWDDDDCECACHDGGSHEYRLMQGTSFEGISIRDVVTDKEGKIAGWSAPVSSPVASVKEAQEDLELTIKELTDVREAFGQPVLDEAKLEAEMETE
jgi:hypothetical protein